MKIQYLIIFLVIAIFFSESRAMSPKKGGACAGPGCCKQIMIGQNQKENFAIFNPNHKEAFDYTITTLSKPGEEFSVQIKKINYSELKKYKTTYERKLSQPGNTLKLTIEIGRGLLKAKKDVSTKSTSLKEMLEIAIASGIFQSREPAISNEAQAAFFPHGLMGINPNASEMCNHYACGTHGCSQNRCKIECFRSDGGSDSVCELCE